VTGAATGAATGTATGGVIDGIFMALLGREVATGVVGAGIDLLGGSRGIPIDGESPNGEMVFVIDGWVGVATESSVGATVAAGVGFKVARLGAAVGATVGRVVGVPVGGGTVP
jgi:hypothetical protein